MKQKLMMGQSNKFTRRFPSAFLFWALVILLMLAHDLSLADSDIQNYGRLSLGLSGREGRSLSHCKPLQDRQSYFFAMRDCNYAELALYFTKDLYQMQDQDDLWVRAHASILAETQMFRDWADTNQQGDEGLRLTQRSFFVEFGNGLQQQEAIWLGRRRYATIYFRILDLYALDVAGPGVGIDRVRFARNWYLSLAFFRNLTLYDGPVQDTLDWRLNWTDNQHQSLTFVALYAQTGRKNPRGGDQRYESAQGMQTVIFHQYEAQRFELWSIVQAGQGLFGSEDGRSFQEGPAEMLNQFGADRRYTFLEEGLFSAERKAIQRSKSFRAAQQFRWLPLEAGWLIEAAWAYQQADFGDLNYIDSAGQVWSRPDSRTQVFVFRPSYEFTKFYGLELSLSQVKIDEGLGQDRILENGEKQTSMESVDRKLQRHALSWKWRPLSWGNAELRVFIASQQWNREIAPDLSQSVQDLRTSSYAAGLNFDMWW
ncbi:MAG: carbohydrate porin [Oligoflexus sp.]